MVGEHLYAHTFSVAHALIRSNPKVPTCFEGKTMKHQHQRAISNVMVMKMVTHWSDSQMPGRFCSWLMGFSSTRKSGRCCVAMNSADCQCLNHHPSGSPTIHSKRSTDCVACGNPSGLYVSCNMFFTRWSKEFWRPAVYMQSFDKFQCWWNVASSSFVSRWYLQFFGFEILRVTVSVKIPAPETWEASFVAFFAHDIVLISA